MTAIRHALPALLLLAAGSAAAEGIPPDAGAEGQRIALAGVARQVEAGPALVFANDGAARSRLVFERSVADAISCQADGVGAERSRAGQYTLAPGGELRCTARPGRHPFLVLRSNGSGIERTSSRLVVR